VERREVLGLWLDTRRELRVLLGGEVEVLPICRNSRSTASAERGGIRSEVHAQRKWFESSVDCSRFLRNKLKNYPKGLNEDETEVHEQHHNILGPIKEDPYAES
jgi:hypothetical protein